MPDAEEQEPWGVRTFRSDLALWEAAKARAAEEGRNVGALVREAIWRYLTGD